MPKTAIKPDRSKMGKALDKITGQTVTHAELVQNVKDAVAIVEEALGPSAADIYREAAFLGVLRELLDYDIE